VSEPEKVIEIMAGHFRHEHLYAEPPDWQATAKVILQALHDAGYVVVERDDLALLNDVRISQESSLNDPSAESLAKLRRASQREGEQ
jgi:hypothetical protein